MLTSKLRSSGFDAFGIDLSNSRFAPLSAAILRLDLSSPQGKKKARELLSHPRLLFVFFAPPCGTCSRARGIPVAGKGPKPLRSEEHPEGLPGLESESRDFARVQAANDLYQFTAQLVSELSALGVAWCVENPDRSFMWSLPSFRALLSAPSVVDVRCSMCMYGGKRNKITRLRFSPPSLFESVSSLCDGSHKHEPWGKLGSSFASALEAAYPAEFAEVLVQNVLRHFGRPALPPLQLVAIRPPELGSPRLLLHRVAAGTQPRGKRAPTLLPEFEEVVCFECDLAPSDATTSPGHVWEACSFQNRSIPKGATTIRTEWRGELGANAAAQLAATPTRGRYKDGVPLLEGDVYIGRGRQRRGGRLLAASVWCNPFPLSSCANLSECLERFRSHLLGAPALLSKVPSLSGKRLVCHCELDSGCHGDVLIQEFVRLAAPGPTPILLHLGLPFSPSAFLDAASRCKHPFELQFTADPLLEMLLLKTSLGVRAVVERRAQTLGKWQLRAAELASAEQALHDAMPEDIAAVMRSKRLYLKRC